MTRRLGGSSRRRGPGGIAAGEDDQAILLRQAGCRCLPAQGGSGVVGRRKQQDPDSDSRRTRFFANRDAARGWISRWQCPEIEWPEVRDVPDPWIVLPADMETWLEIHVPRMNEYYWFIEGRPLAQGVNHAWARWSIGAEHAFEGADIELRTVADPPFLAEALALGADAAALDGWRPDDIHALHRWLLEGLDTRPLSHAVRGNKRTGSSCSRSSAGRPPTTRSSPSSR
jgi:hypothetical protein